VLELTPGGRERKSRFTVDRASVVSGGTTKELLPKGTVLVAERGAGGTTFQVDDAPAAADVGRLLKMLINLESDEGINDDAVFGTKQRRKVGETWPVNAEAMAADMAEKAHLKLDPKNVTGATKLAAIVQVDGRAAMQIATEFSIKDVAPNLPPGMVLDSSEFKATFGGVFPVDTAKRARNGKMTMAIRTSCSGTNNGRQVSLTMESTSTTERTFSAE